MKKKNTIRMRPYGARIIIIIMLLVALATITAYGLSKPQVPQLKTPSVKTPKTAVTMMIPSPREELSPMKQVPNPLKEAKKTLYAIAEEREQKKIEEQLRLEEEARIRAEEERLRAEREARVYNMIWSGAAGEYQLYAWSLFPNYGWDEYDLECLIELWRRESQWNPLAHNSSSGAHGIPQSLPASKMASHGADYWDNPYTQIGWGTDYILSRYGSPRNALAHSNAYGWY